MVSSDLVAFSFAALSGIATSTILRNRSSSLKINFGFRRVKADCDAEIKEGKDFISQLPDDILVTILELLPTRESVRTSILSKRWRNLYAFVPHMELLCCLQTFPFKRLDHLSNHKSGDFMKKSDDFMKKIMDRVYIFQEDFMKKSDDFMKKFMDRVYISDEKFMDAAECVFVLSESILLIVMAFLVVNVWRELRETIPEMENLVKKGLPPIQVKIKFIEFE